MNDRNAETPDSLLLDHQLCFAVYSTGNALTRLYSELLADAGLSYTQYLVLLVLWEEDGMTIKEIGNRLLLDSGTLTPVIRRLEQRGLAVRERDAHDQRRVHALLTDAGRELEPRVRAAREKVFHATQMSADELRALRQQLLHLRTKLNLAVDAMEAEATNSKADKP